MPEGLLALVRESSWSEVLKSLHALGRTVDVQSKQMPDMLKSLHPVKMMIASGA